MQPYVSDGGFYPRKLEMEGSFRVNASSDPDDIRDGNTNLISVVRVSAGLFRVTIAERFALPVKCVTEEAWLNPVDATPVLVCSCAVVADSYSPVTRTFDILCTKVADVGASAYFDPAPADPDDNSRIGFRMAGSLSPVGTD
jgi:hypothetical protein